MIKELNFKNLTIKYDGDKISKSIMRKVKTVEVLGVFLIIALFFWTIGIECFYIDAENNFVLSMVVSIVSMLLILVGGSFGLAEICKKIAPRHYEFVTWLMKYKSNKIEIGWLNDRYVVNMYGQHGWIKKEFGNFIDEDYKWEDKADNSKPVHMIINLTDEDVEVIVENR